MKFENKDKWNKDTATTGATTNKTVNAPLGGGATKLPGSDVTHKGTTGGIINRGNLTNKDKGTK